MATRAVIRVLGSIHRGELPQPCYLKEYWPDAYDGGGDSIYTDKLDDAKTFPSKAAAFEFWRQQSTVRPLRPDGKPNRPLTEFTVVIEDLT